MSRAEIDGFDAADVRRALGAIGDGPVVDSVEELLERGSHRDEQHRGNRGPLLFAVAVIVVVGLGGIAVVAGLRNGTDAITADLAGCSQAQWCVEEPRGLAMVGREVFALSAADQLVAVDRITGRSRLVEVPVVLTERARVAGGLRDGLLIVDEGRLLVVNPDGELRTRLERPEGSVFVDAAAEPNGSWIVATIDDPGGVRRIVVVEDAQVISQTETVAGLDHLATVRDGQTFGVDSASGQLLVVADGQALLNVPQVSMVDLPPVVDTAPRGNAILVLAQGQDTPELLELRPASGESGYWPALPHDFEASYVAANSQTRRIAVSSTTGDRILPLEPPAGTDGAFSDPDE